MVTRLTEEQRSLMDDGKALVAHCAECQHELFLGELPMDAMDVAKRSKAKCPNDPRHTIFMGPIKAE